MHSQHCHRYSDLDRACTILTRVCRENRALHVAKEAQLERCNHQYSCTIFAYIVYKSNFSFESVFRAAMGSRGGPSSGRGKSGKGVAGPSGPGNGPAPAAAPAAAGRGGVVRTPVPDSPAAAAPPRPAAAPAGGPPESPRPAVDETEQDNEGEDANENAIVSPEEITASRRDGTNAKRRFSGDACIEGFDKNAVGFCIL